MEAFRILDWAKRDPALAPVLRGIDRRARASAHRLNSRYLVDAGLPRQALREWFAALSLHPTTALTRLNLLSSALLDLMGMSFIREGVLRVRRERLSR
jgi:hypothetical protein